MFWTPLKTKVGFVIIIIICAMLLWEVVYWVLSEITSH